jgi:RNA polymerase sigma-70 factor (ECF subfamily)
MQPVDRDLIMRAKSGEMDAFEELVCRYDRQVLSIAMNFTKDSDQAKDIYQEVFLKVYKSLDGFAFKSQFSTWLYRVATNVSLSYISSEKRRRQVSIDQETEATETQRRQVKNKLVSKPDSDRKAFSREIASRIQSALNHLSAQQRAVFVLRHYEGHRLREIAAILECAEGTVKKHLFTATARMRENLRELHA